ncbi:hypothetical protein F4780DRAFT_165395 [Xylariomycetidae sp. FL0641]|nr:hypothetical protein F4780DRAFT_165395 [Xylariomycetidae sp. FL0641]
MLTHTTHTHTCGVPTIGPENQHQIKESELCPVLPRPGDLSADTLIFVSLLSKAQKSATVLAGGPSDPRHASQTNGTQSPTADCAANWPQKRCTLGSEQSIQYSVRCICDPGPCKRTVASQRDSASSRLTCLNGIRKESLGRASSKAVKRLKEARSIFRSLRCHATYCSGPSSLLLYIRWSSRSLLPTPVQQHLSCSSFKLPLCSVCLSTYGYTSKITGFTQG